MLSFFTWMLCEGWRFVTPGEIINGENTVPDPMNNAQIIRDIYLLADPNYSGRFSVPVLWDKKTKTIVSIERDYSDVCQRIR